MLLEKNLIFFQKALYKWIDSCYNTRCSSKNNKGETVLANHKSALKRVAVTAKKNLNNRVITSRVKTAIKSFDKSLEAGDQAAITAAYVNAVSTVDKAAAKGVLHKNNANRKKAQLALKLAAKAN